MSKMLLQQTTLRHKKCPKSFLGTLSNVKLVILCIYLIFEKNGHYALLEQPDGLLAAFNIQDIIDDLFVDCEDLIAYLHDTNSSQYDDTNKTILNEWFRSTQNVIKGVLNNTFAFVDNATYSYTTESNLNHTVDPIYNLTLPILKT